MRALKIIYDEKYKDYQQTLNKIDLETLAERKENVYKMFAKKGLSNIKITKNIF